MISLHLIYRRIVHPIQMAQTRGGLMLAAALILCWQSSQTVLAAVVNPGFSENDFFRLEWDYDLVNGTGQIRFGVNVDGMGNFFADYLNLDDAGRFKELHVMLTALEFRTYGVPFDSVASASSRLFRNPTLINAPGDPPVYQYRKESAIGDSIFGYGSFSEEVFDVTFPTENIGLAESSLVCGGGLSAGYGYGEQGWALSAFFGDIVPPSDDEIFFELKALDFVSVQQIPEPGTAAILAGGAAMAGIRGRVCRGLRKLFKNQAEA